MVNEVIFFKAVFCDIKTFVQLFVKHFILFSICFTLVPVSGTLSFLNLTNDEILKLVKQNPDTKKFFCAICQRHCADKIRTLEHVRSIHVGLRDISCIYCPELFVTNHQRNKHIYRVHGDHHKLAKILKS